MQGERGWVRFETMLKIRKIEHVAIAVNDIDQALVKYREVLGLTPTAREHVASQKTDAALLPLGESSIELIAPRGNEGLARFLEKRGPGLHHIALEIEGIDEALSLLKTMGVRLIDESPPCRRARAPRGLRAPRSDGGVLIELVEKSSSP